MPMRALRSQTGSRLLVALVTTSLFTALFVPLVGTAQQAAGQSYADWLRKELDGYDAAVFEQALQAATASHPRSFDAFLDAFTEALFTRPEAVLDEAVAAALDVSKAALLRHLYGRYMRLAGMAVPPRTMLVVAAAYQGKAPQRPDYRGVAHPEHGPLAPVAPVEVGEDIPSFVLPVRVRSAARPLGP